MQNNQQSTATGYLAAIKFFHRIYAGWELPTSHCMIVAVGKENDHAHGASQKSAQVRLPLTWTILVHGRQVVTSMVDGGNCHVVGPCVVVLCAMSRVGVVGLRERKRAPRVLSDTKRSHLLSRGATGRDRKQIDHGLGIGTVRGVENRPEEGRVHDHSDACSKSGRHRGGGPAGA